jgi:predicted transcriptional regulator of viral defense system
MIFSENKMKLGTRELQLLAWGQLRKKMTIESGEIRRAFQITADQERNLLSRMARKGLIVRLRRGLYLVPDRIPLNGKWNPHEYVVNNYLMDDAGAIYQITGPTAFNFYSLTEQMPNTIYEYNDKISGKRKIRVG